MASGLPGQFADPAENGMNVLRSKMMLWSCDIADTRDCR